jgi:pyruvate kinase
VATRTGKTAMALSRQRGAVPVLGVSDNPQTARRMTLYWGVTPLLNQMLNVPPQELLHFVVQWGCAHDILRSGGKLVLVASSQWSAEGHDMLLVHSIS